MKNFIRCDDQGREVVPGDDYCIVYDPATNLEWLADLLPESHNFQSAGHAAASLDLAGGSWRLPTYHEALSIVDVTRSTPARDPAFRATINTSKSINERRLTNEVIWTSTSDASSPMDDAWAVFFQFGHLGVYLKSMEWWVRPCRMRGATS